MILPEFLGLLASVLGLPSSPTPTVTTTSLSIRGFPGGFPIAPPPTQAWQTWSLTSWTLHTPSDRASSTADVPTGATLTPTASDGQDLSSTLSIGAASSISSPTDASPISSPTDTPPIDSPTDTSSISSPTDTSPISSPTDTPLISSPTDTPPIDSPTDTSSISSPTDTSPISSPTDTPLISSPTDTPSISSPTDTSSISSPTDNPLISSPTDTPSISSPTDPPISSPTDTHPISSPTATSSISSPTDTPSISSPTDASPISSPTDTSPISSPTDTSPISSPTDTSPISSPTDTSPISSPTDTSPISSPTDASSISSTTDSFSAITGSGIGGSVSTSSGTEPPTGIASDSTSFTSTASLAVGSSGVIGTITATGLTTYSAIPPSISTITTSVTTNTHDSSGHPILGPWPICWFCPVDSTGIVLLDLLPGVYPGGGPPAGWPTPFPPLTINLNGDPTYPESSATSPENSATLSQSSTGTITSCTSTAIATDITVYLTVVTDSTQSASTSTISTATALQTGCGVTGTTVTSTTTGSCDNCCLDWSIQVDSCAADNPDLECDDSSAAALRVRGLAGRITMTVTEPASLVRRVAGHGQFGACLLSTKITTPDYPRVSAYANYPAASSYYVATYDPAGNPSCIPTWTKVANLAGVSTANGGSTYVTVSVGSLGPWVNSDHVYELQILKYFFNAQLAGLSPQDCQDFSAFFEDAVTKHLQKIWNYMPSNNYPDMAAMDNVVNARKGDFFQSTGSLNMGQGLAALTQAYANYGMAAAAVAHADFVELFQRTHQRIFEAFKGIDCSIAASNPAGQQTTWASAYSTFISNYLNSIAAAASSAAETALNAMAGSNFATAALRATFPPDLFSIPVGQMASLNAAAAARAVKRQDACQAIITDASSVTSITTSATPAAIPDSAVPTTTTTTPPPPPLSAASIISAESPPSDLSATMLPTSIVTAESPPSDPSATILPLPTLSDTGTHYTEATAVTTYVTCPGLGSARALTPCIDTTLTDVYLSPGTPSFDLPGFQSTLVQFSGSNSPILTATEVTLRR